MGYFSYTCDGCGEHEQFDVTVDCIIKLELIDSIPIFVKGRYDGSGCVDILIKDTKTIQNIPLIQFSDYFNNWGIEITSVAYEIYCHGLVSHIPEEECDLCYDYEDEEGYEHSHKEISRKCFCGKYKTSITSEELAKLKPYEN